MRTRRTPRPAAASGALSPTKHFIPLAAGVCESRDASLWRTALRVEAHELDVAAIGLYVGADLVLEDLLDGTHPPVVLALRRRLPRLLLLHAMTRHFGTVTERGGERQCIVNARQRIVNTSPRTHVCGENCTYGGV